VGELIIRFRQVVYALRIPPLHPMNQPAPTVMIYLYDQMGPKILPIPPKRPRIIS
jgi:hypothetical protein